MFLLVRIKRGIQVFKMFRKENNGEYIKILKFKSFDIGKIFLLDYNCITKQKNIAVLQGGGTPGRDHKVLTYRANEISLTTTSAIITFFSMGVKERKGLDMFCTLWGQSVSSPFLFLYRKKVNTWRTSHKLSYRWKYEK